MDERNTAEHQREPNAASDCPSAELVRELLANARAAAASHGPNSVEALEAHRRLNAAQEARADTLANLSDDERAAMRRLAVDDYNRRLAAFRAEAAGASAAALNDLYASLRRQVSTVASSRESSRPRTTLERPREQSTTSRRHGAHAPPDDPPRPPKLCKRCAGALSGRQRDYCSTRCKSATLMAAKRKRDQPPETDDKLKRYRNAIAAARRSDEINDLEALELLTCDVDEARRRLLEHAPDHLKSAVAAWFDGLPATESKAVAA